MIVFNKHVMEVFASNDTDYNSLKNLMMDYTTGSFSDNVSKSEAREKIYDISLQLFGLNRDTVKNERDRKRAIRDNSRAFFDVIEEVEDYKITVGIQENEIFNQYVEYRNLNYGDTNMFYTDEDIILSVSKTAGDHHDISLQPYEVGSTYSIPVAAYVAKVGADINRYLLNQIDFDALISAISTAYVKKIQESLYAELVAASAKLPAQEKFVGTGKLDATQKSKFDDILNNVRMANDGADIAVLGTDKAVRQLNNLVAGGAITWTANSQKEAIANTGRLATYEGTSILVMPNRFEDKTFQKTVFADDSLLFVPLVNDDTNKPVKMVDVGTTEIFEVNDKAAHVDDFKDYEVTRRWGIGSRISRIFGKWTIEA